MVYLESVLVETVYRYASLRCVFVTYDFCQPECTERHFSESILKEIFSISTCFVFGFVFRYRVSCDETCLILGC